MSGARNVRWRVAWSRCLRGGFTLIEISIVTVIFLVIAGGLFTAFLTGRTSFFTADAYIQVQQEGRRAFDTMVRELREARLNNPGGTSVQLGTDAVQLNFQIARGYAIEASCQSPDTICWGSEEVTGEWVHYAIIENTTDDIVQLQRCRSAAGSETTTSAWIAGSCRVLANHVRVVDGTPNFELVDDPLPGGDTKVDRVVIKLQIGYDHPMLPGGSLDTAMLTSTIEMRNKRDEE